MTMTTEYNDSTITVIDSEGGVWWPNEEAQAEIDASENPKAAAIQMAEEQPMRGTWKQ